MHAKVWGRRGRCGTGRAQARFGSPRWIRSVPPMIARGAQAYHREAAPTVIAITGAAGQPGRTTVAANLAVALGERGQRVLVLDADFTRPRVDASLGLEPRGDISQVLRGERSLKDILLPGPPGVSVVPGSTRLGAEDDMGITEPAAVIWALDALYERIDILLIDTAAGLRPEVITFTRAAHHVVIVVRDTSKSIDESRALIMKLAREHSLAHFKVLASQTPTLAAGAMLCKRLQRACEHLSELRLEFAGTVPHDPAVGRSIHSHQSVMEAAPRSAAAQAFRAIAARVATWPPPEGVRGHLEFFVGRLARAEMQEGI